MSDDKTQRESSSQPESTPDVRIEDIPLSAEQEDQIQGGGLISQKGALMNLGG